MISVCKVRPFKALGVESLELDETKAVIGYLRSKRVDDLLTQARRNKVKATLTKDRFILAYPERYCRSETVITIIDQFWRGVDLKENYLGIFTGSKVIYEACSELIHEGIYISEEIGKMTDGDISRILYYLYEDTLYKGYHYPHID